MLRESDEHTPVDIIRYADGEIYIFGISCFSTKIILLLGACFSLSISLNKTLVRYMLIKRMETFVLHIGGTVAVSVFVSVIAILYFLLWKITISEN